MVEERDATQADFDLIAMQGLDDGFNLAPIELARLLQMGQNRSAKCVAYEIDGELVAVAGLMMESLLSDEAHMWLVVSHAHRRHQIAFARYSKKAQAALPYRVVTCFCDPAFAHTLRWLEWLDFRPAGDVEIMGRMFMTFLWEAPNGH